MLLTLATWNKAASMSEPIYTLEDLKTWSRRAPTLAVLGSPIAHSISPAMHNAALAVEQVTNQTLKELTYVRFEIKPEDLKVALPLLHTKGFLGINLTVPHKIIAFSLIEKIDPSAVLIGAVNTLRRTATGWEGFNTDGYGLATAVKETLGLNLADSDIILLGAGGAARGAAVECLLAPCKSLTIINRSRDSLSALINQLSPSAKTTHLRALLTSELSHTNSTQLPAGALVINATSSGLKLTDEIPVDLNLIPKPSGVYDMIYNPPKTKLLNQAEVLSLPIANGLSMLVHQGARSLEIWTKLPAARTAPVMFSAATKALASHI